MIKRFETDRIVLKCKDIATLTFAPYLTTKFIFLRSETVMINNRRTFLSAAALAFAVPLAGCGVNSVPTAEEVAKNAFANYQAALQRRADLLPNLNATVKGAATHEKEVQIGVTNARAAANVAGAATLSAADLTDPAKVKAFQDAQGAASAAFLSIRNTVEAYPDVKANENFRDLSVAIEATENRITIALKDYNAAVQSYNTTIRTFPDAIGAKIFYGSKPMVPFAASAPNPTKAPEVKF
jgi:LemA protein